MRRSGRALKRALFEVSRYATTADRRAIRRELTREAFFRIAARFTPTVEVDWPSGRYLVATADRDVSRLTFVERPFDLPILTSAARLIREHTSASLEGREVIEVGANIGTTTIPLVTSFGVEHVHAFEPAPGNYRLLRLNIEANDLGTRVTARRLAISDRAGQLPFAVPPHHPGSSHVAVSHEDSNVEIVPCVTLDQILQQGLINGDRIGLVWIDTEGHELAVMEGARSLGSVPVVIEYNPQHRSHIDRLDGVIQGRHTALFELPSGVPISFRALVKRGLGVTTDLLLLP